MRVPDPGEQNRLDDQVESLAHQDAVERLRDLDSRVPQRARPDRDAGPGGQSGLKLVELLDRCREVGVGQQDLVSLCGLDANGQPATLAAVARQRLHANAIVATE